MQRVAALQYEQLGIIYVFRVLIRWFFALTNEEGAADRYPCVDGWNALESDQWCLRRYSKPWQGCEERS